MTRSNKSSLKSSLELPHHSATLPKSGYAIYLLLGLLFIGYVALTVNGYGNHDDIYRMIGTWRTLISEHRYVPSRFQGYLIPELVIGFSSQLGGFHLSNLVSSLLAIASLFIFYRLLLKIVPAMVALLATAAVGSNPYWIIAATTSTDYVYPAFFFLLGVLLLVQYQFRIAGLVFALAVSSRITYGPMVVLTFGFYLPYLTQRYTLRGRFMQGVILFFLGCVALYLPVFFASGMTLSFLGFASETSGGTFGIIARFLYKNVYLWGLPAFIVLAVFLIQERSFYWNALWRNPLNGKGSTLLYHAVFWCLLYNELLYLRLPHQYQYLLPVLFCVGYLVAAAPSLKKRIICLSLVFGLQLIYAVYSVDLLDTYQTEGVNQTIHSDAAKFDPSIKAGVLVRDYQWRSIYQRHLTNDFNQRWQHVGAPLENPR